MPDDKSIAVPASGRLIPKLIAWHLTPGRKMEIGCEVAKAGGAHGRRPAGERAWVPGARPAAQREHCLREGPSRAAAGSPAAP